MAAIFGMGYAGLALYHLITHAFFKALLFLGAGAVITPVTMNNLFLKWVVCSKKCRLQR